MRLTLQIIKTLLIATVYGCSTTLKFNILEIEKYQEAPNTLDNDSSQPLQSEERALNKHTRSFKKTNCFVFAKTTTRDTIFEEQSGSFGVTREATRPWPTRTKQQSKAHNLM